MTTCAKCGKEIEEVSEGGNARGYRHKKVNPNVIEHTDNVAPGDGGGDQQPVPPKREHPLHKRLG